MMHMNSRVEMAERMEITTPTTPSLTSKQNIRLLVALSLLLVALVVILVKDRDFWFGSEEAVETEATSESVAQTNPAPVPAKTIQAPAAPPAIVKNHKVAKTAAQPAISEPIQQPAADQASPVITTNRVVLPPLDIEVVAGDTHRTVHPGSNVAKVVIPSDATRASAFAAPAAALPANAAARERLTPVSVPDLRQSIDSTYPLLAQNMKVQGSVVLQAIISTDGNIENLTVVSGPAILATAAQQAVRQWRFKPYYENGQPVETKTRITVNFSIRVSDPAKAS
jgi:protein TonB